MQNVNLVNLNGGLNTIEITYEDLGFESSKIPIAILPKGYTIKNVVFDIEKEFKTGGLPGQINSDSYIKFRMKLGTSNETDYILTRTDVDTSGLTDANTGSYFSSNNTSFDEDIKLYLETWVIPRLWTVTDSLSTARRGIGSAGSQIAGLAFGGANGIAVTDEYNGSTWSTGGSLLSGRDYTAGCGTQTAALCIGGNAGGYTATTEEYNGSSWSNVGSMNTAREQTGATGTTGAGLSFGGWNGTTLSVSEEWNGSSWSVGNSLNAGESNSNGFGIQISTVKVGWVGTEEYNGNIWTTANQSNIQKHSAACAGISQEYGVCFAGDNNTDLITLTEEYTNSVWIIGNDTNEAREHLGGCGTQSSALSFGGYTTTYVATSEEYNDINISQVTPDGALTLNITLV